MRFLSLFSGIEAASVAWEPLGWTPVAFAEIEPFPCALLAHRFPNVPNLGDVTKIEDAQIAALGTVDVVIGGSPCQDLSVAGKRAGLKGERSSLFHEQVRIFDAARTLCGARWLVWENVPGAFSTHSGRDFAVVVGALAGCKLAVPVDGWGNEGVALGPSGLIEWSVLDAQWFGVAQRRRRVFAILDAGNWAGRPPVLLEPESPRGDPPTRGEARERTAGGTLRSTLGGSDVDHARAGHLMPRTVGALLSTQHKGPGHNRDDTVVPCAPTLRAGGNRTGGDRPPGTDVDTCDSLIPVAHALRADGFDASEDGTGRGTPIVPVTTHALDSYSAGRATEDGTGRGAPIVPVAFDGMQVTSRANRSNPQPGDASHPLTGAGAGAALLAFSCKDHGADAGDLAPTLRSMNEGGGNANAGGQVAVAFAIQGAAGRDNPSSGPDGVGVRGDDRAYTIEARAEVQAVAFQERGRNGERNLEVGGDVAYALTAPASGGRAQERNVATAMQVRRLTPTECERLQGFPDGWTAIPYRDKPAADGPRYKALGNSMAVPVIAWIGRQIERSHRASQERAAA